MPFGLKNASSVFQRAITRALGELAYSYAVVYIDDVLIVAGTREDAYERLDRVFNVLIEAGFSFNMAKCAFMKPSVEYLGYKVENGELRANPRRIEALAALPPPQSVTQLRQFIGLSSYFRQFVPQFSEHMKPLYLLTSKNNQFEWEQKHEQVRQKIISTLVSDSVLIIYDPQYPVELHTDASSMGYGAILMHKVNGKPRVIEYYSKCTSAAESKYHSYELATLAVFNAVKHFRHYLHGRPFVVYTDCNSLKASWHKIELSPRVHRCGHICNHLILVWSIEKGFIWHM